MKILSREHQNQLKRYTFSAGYDLTTYVLRSTLKFIVQEMSLRSSVQDFFEDFAKSVKEGNGAVRNWKSSVLEEFEQGDDECRFHARD